MTPQAALAPTLPNGDDQVRGDEGETVEFLVDRAKGRTALEFAIGTGRIARVATDRVVLDINRHDPVTQILDENHVSLSDNGVRMGRSPAASSGQAKWTSWPESLA